ncbi:MAG: FecR family protein [Betaproteobacteria bacterium]
MRGLLGVGILVFSAAAFAADVGEIKTTAGAAHLERGGAKLPVKVGMQVRQADKVVTGADGAVGITFLDNTLVSAGPNSTLVIDTYRFDSTTHAGKFDASLQRGSLAVISGKMVKQSPDAMRIRTPSSVLGVRGTEFVVKVADPQ